MEAVLMICAGVFIGGAAVYLATPKGALLPDKPSVRSGDITDLLERLKPFARNPDAEYGGVTVRINGASAQIEIEMKDFKAATGRGRTLDEAVDLLRDSERFRKALDGWKSQP